MGVQLLLISSVCYGFDRRQFHFLVTKLEDIATEGIQYSNHIPIIPEECAYQRASLVM